MSRKSKDKPTGKSKSAFIPCSVMELPDELRIERIGLLTSKFWGPVIDLSVSFLDTTNTALKNKILAYANKWGQYGNIKFRESASGVVRITRGNSGYWSYLGTDVKSIAAGQPTMNLQEFLTTTSDAEYDRVVTHEFGHTLGFPHEHMRDTLVRRLDEAKTIAYFRQTQGWSEQETRQQVLTPLSEASLMATPPDQDSIMCYQLPGSITRDGQPIRGGAKINATDEAFVAKTFPKLDAPPPPGPPPVAASITLWTAIRFSPDPATVPLNGTGNLTGTYRVTERK